MKKNILIVEDNYEFAMTVYNYINNNNEYVKILGIAINGEEALKFIEKTLPDIILLDLNMPKLNGIEFLNKINNLNIAIFIISGEIKYINAISYNNFDIIKKIYIKPFNISKLNEDLKNIYFEPKKTNIRNIIENELSKFNFNKGSEGYIYLIACIEKSVLEPQVLINMEKNLFPYISEKYNITNPKLVKWALHKLLNSMSRFTDDKILLTYFPFTKNPTLKLFISTINNNVIKKSKSA